MGSMREAAAERAVLHSECSTADRPDEKYPGGLEQRKRWWTLVGQGRMPGRTPRRRVCCSRRLTAFSLRMAARLAYSAVAFFSAGSSGTARLAW